MRLVITEKQLRGIIKNAEVKEQEATTPAPEASSTPDSSPSGDSTSSSSSDSGATGGGGTGYPSVTKWESGVTRGPANQITVSKWSDVVGGAINRGKANPLT
jgi:hypothetical protein